MYKSVIGLTMVGKSIKKTANFFVQVRGPRNHLQHKQESSQLYHERLGFLCVAIARNFLGFGLAKYKAKTLNDYILEFYIIYISIGCEDLQR